MNANRTYEEDYNVDVAGFAFKIGADIRIHIGGIPVDMLIDSGATCNIIDRSMWEKLKQAQISCSSQRCVTEMYAYGHKRPDKNSGEIYNSCQMLCDR